MTGVLEPCPNGTAFFEGFDDLASFDKIKDKVLERTQQATYCSPDRNFCFYDYDDGKVPPVNGLDSTNVPTIFSFTEAFTAAPEAAPRENDENGPIVESSTPSPVQPSDPPQTLAPSIAPIPRTDVPTISPTPFPSAAPTPTPPVTQEPAPDPNSGSGSGSDGFDMDEIGSDGFNPNDLFG